MNRAVQGPASDAPSRWRHVFGRHGPRWWLGMALLAVACAGLAVLYYRQSLTAPFTSDGAGNVLQGQAIAAGNPLLRGWWSSDVSFYSTELPEYALVTAIRGLSPDVVHICGALTYTLIVLLTALTARGRSRGAAGYYRAGIAAGMTLALSVTGSIGLYLENPDHAGTVVPVLLLLLLLDRAERRAEDGADDRAGGGWLIPVAACAVLVIADVGDKLTLAAAILPLMIVCAVRLTAGRLTAGRVLSGEPDRAQLRLDRRLLLAAIVSIGLAELANLAIRALGGLVLRPVNGVAFAPLGVPAHARLLWQAIVILFGANQPGVTHQPQLISAHLPVALMAGFHVIGLLLAAAGLAVGLASLRSRHADRATLVLVVSVLAIVAFGVFTTLVQSRSYFHEVAPLLPLSAALAGRVLVPLAARRLPAPLRRYTWLPGVALGAWLALTVAELGYTASWPALTPPQQSVAAWLVIHHERAGLAGYFQATSTTVTSGGQVLVAGITLPAGAAAGQPASDRPAAYRWESSADWYQPARHDATFVIAVAGPAGARAGGLPVPAVRASFGRPVAEYRIGDEVIMLYGYNLLTRLTPTAFPG